MYCFKLWGFYTFLNYKILEFGETYFACHCMTPQGIGSSVRLKYLGTQNVKIEIRRSSEVLVPQDPISHRRLLSHVPSSSAVAMVSFWLSIIKPILPSPVSVLVLTSFLTGSPVLSLYHPTLFFMLPHNTCSATPESHGVACSQLKCQPLQHTSLLASTSSVPGSLQRTSRPVQLIKAPKVTEKFHYEAEGTEVLKPDPDTAEKRWKTDAFCQNC